MIIPAIIILAVLAASIYYYEPHQAEQSALSLSQKTQNTNELILAMSQFDVIIGEDGLQSYVAGDAQVWVVHPDEDWKTEILFNHDSNVAHKGEIADLDGDGLNELWVAGGQKATLKAYRKINGSWNDELVWNPPFIRVRDIEAGDVDGDGLPELVAGTHKGGVVAVIEYMNNSWSITEVDRKNETYIHEIEIADVNGDGLGEFFSNPTEPNIRKGLPQSGSIVMHRWNNSGYQHILITELNNTHAKEIVVGDIDNDGLPELIAAVFGSAAETNDSAQYIQKGLIEMEIEVPLRIVVWDFQNEPFHGEVISEISDIKARSLAVGDADNDGLNELIVGTDSRGLQLIQWSGGMWQVDMIDSNLTGNIHEVVVLDIDNDGLNEIVASSDMMGIVNLYRITSQGWNRETVIDNLENYWIWAMDWGDADNE